MTLRPLYCFITICTLVVLLVPIFSLARDEEPQSCEAIWEENTEGLLRVRGFDIHGGVFLNVSWPYDHEVLKEIKINDDPKFPGWFHGYSGYIIPQPGEKTVDNGSWGIVLRFAGTKKPVAAPLHPSGQFYLGEVPGGSAVLYRHANSDFSIKSIVVRYEEEEMSLEPISIVQAVRFQLQGDHSLHDQSRWSEDQRTIWEILLAYESSEGK